MYMYTVHVHVHSEHTCTWHLCKNSLQEETMQLVMIYTVVLIGGHLHMWQFQIENEHYCLFS